MDEGEFFETESIYAAMAWLCPICVFLVLFWVNLCVCSFSVLLRHLALFPCCLLIRLFCYVLLVAIFYSKIVYLPLYPALGMSSYQLLLLFSRISLVVLKCHVLSVLFYPVSISFKSSFFLSPVLSGLFPQVLLSFFLCCFFFFVLTGFSVFPFCYHFHLFS